MPRAERGKRKPICRDSLHCACVGRGRRPVTSNQNIPIRSKRRRRRRPVAGWHATLDGYLIEIRDRIIVGGVWTCAGWSLDLHELRYGRSYVQDTYYAGPNIYSNTVFYDSVNNARYDTNLELGYEWPFGLQWVVGAQNLFNKTPEVLPPENRYIGVALYDGNTAIGIDGAHCYTRLSYAAAARRGAAMLLLASSPFDHRTATDCVTVSGIHSQE